MAEQSGAWTPSAPSAFSCLRPKRTSITTPQVRTRVEYLVFLWLEQHAHVGEGSHARFLHEFEVLCPLLRAHNLGHPAHCRCLVLTRVNSPISRRCCLGERPPLPPCPGRSAAIFSEVYGSPTTRSLSMATKAFLYSPQVMGTFRSHSTYRAHLGCIRRTPLTPPRNACVRSAARPSLRHAAVHAARRPVGRHEGARPRGPRALRLFDRALPLAQDAQPIRGAPARDCDCDRGRAPVACCLVDLTLLQLSLPRPPCPLRPSR